MERIALIMYLHPGNQFEYHKRHNQLWPDMKLALKEHGASNYSIFLDQEANTLFAYLEVENKADFDKIAETDICKKWWAYMAPIMKSNPDNSPVAKNLKQVFYLA
ncbi:L-rhamnose mutarotase [Paenibacillus motobuensis]|uniref:L-rhamnose mutarotase n=1 Tax=Paenibacillus TaxID=44249 RepID=UPI00203FE101|nr:MULTISPECIES: L-rhamnose mutarotase [Paenibacillus]MCM3041555.1 L-rhamnose mutarotase [Paenibacillus lutimineralis]MCM3648659.1 L-rhamnose mutarotase [Paenibacillus motobuensis]